MTADGRLWYAFFTDIIIALVAPVIARLGLLFIEFLPTEVTISASYLISRLVWHLSEPLEAVAERANRAIGAHVNVTAVQAG